MRGGNSGHWLVLAVKRPDWRLFAAKRFHWLSGACGCSQDHYPFGTKGHNPVKMSHNHAGGGGGCQAVVFPRMQTDRPPARPRVVLPTVALTTTTTAAPTTWTTTTTTTRISIDFFFFGISGNVFVLVTKEHSSSVSKINLL